MVPQVVNSLISIYGKTNEPLADLYVGSGTVAVEASKLGYDVICSDINPLARLLTQVKTTYVEPEKLENFKEKIKNNYSLNISSQEIEAINTKIINLEYWFKLETIKGLASLRSEIFQIQNPKIQNFFKVCFSATVRKASNVRTREFKLYRRSLDELKSYSPNPLTIFLSNVDKGIAGMAYIKDIKNMPVILGEDSRQSTVRSDTVGTIITSPPYGDSNTTVAYGQFSKYPLLWLNYELDEVRKIDKISIGGELSIDKDMYSQKKSPTLKKASNLVKRKDIKRNDALLRFFNDLDSGLKEMRRILKKERLCIIIIGNRTVSGIPIPTVKITKELAEQGWEIEGRYERFQCLDIKERRIYQKRMPYVGAPNGRTGEWELCDLIMNESIIILKSV
jgi:site-specific DNA-methyltransferase (cytosine-N4-specific)